MPDDIASQVIQLGIRARVVAGRGELAPAEAAARDAVGNVVFAAHVGAAIEAAANVADGSHSEHGDCDVATER